MFSEVSDSPANEGDLDFVELPIMSDKALADLARKTVLLGVRDRSFEDDLFSRFWVRSDELDSARMEGYDHPWIDINLAVMLESSTNPTMLGGIEGAESTYSAMVCYDKGMTAKLRIIK